MEIFMKLRGKFEQYDPERPFSAWLYRVAANHCWDQLRRRSLRQDRETGDDVESLPLAHHDPSQLDRMITARSGEEVRLALRKLPARARAALVMRYYAEMDYEEIADALGVQRTFVGVVLLRARQQLRNAMGGESQIAASRGNT